MKRLILCFLLLGTLSISAQVTTIPEYIYRGYRGPVTIVFDPTQGNRGMVNASQCYAHTGVTYDGRSWQHCGSWRDGKDKYRMTLDEQGCWRLEMSNGIYTYYGVDTSKVITQLCFVFNDGPNGSKEGKTSSGGDIFVDLYTEAPTDPIIEPRPAGLQLGITYYPDDPTMVTLCMFAGHCLTANDPSVLVPESHVFLLGDFNDWTITNAYQLHRDSCYFWLTLTDLQPGKEYAFQYLVMRTDGANVRLSDPFATKQLHEQDKYEPRTTDPTLRAYPAGGDGSYASVFQTAQEPYQWSEATLTFRRPNPNNLIIYELWTYDYTDSRNFRGLTNRLDYLQQLGVNAIELMPVCEFDGNYNWGYSPNHYFAVDKAYGSATMFRQLVDSIHAHGMAVILDMVFNHATGQNPQNKLYPYGSDLKYNPWFNANPPHGDNFYEDWNHDFPETRAMFLRALNYWLDDYKVDGFRMDLSHGLCGKTLNAYDNLLYYYQNAILPHQAYFILEHWGSKMNTERPQLIQQGMFCWQNTNNAYSQLAMGYTSESSLSAASKPGYVSYCESHDEERNYYKALTWGAEDITTNKAKRLSRVPLTMAFNLLLQGPHMIWQYNELGYDYSINMNEQGVLGDYRTNIKPRPDQMGWFSDSLRMAQYSRVAQIVQLRTHICPDLFLTTPVSSSLASGWIRSIHWVDGDTSLYIVGNFSPSESLLADLPEGTWYDYFTGELLTGSSLLLSSGQLTILTSVPLSCPTIDTTPFARYNTGYIEPGRTAIEQLSSQSDTEVEATKILYHGSIYILREGRLYDLLGRPINSKL